MCTPSFDKLIKSKWSGVFKFGSSRCNVFKTLQSHQVLKYEMYDLKKEDEEDIFYTTHWFHNVNPFQTIRFSYNETSSGLRMFLHPEDKKYLIYYLALNEDQLLHNVANNGMYVETKMPFLLRGLLYEKDDVFQLCYTHFISLIPTQYFKRSHRLQRLKELSLGGYFEVKNLFDKFLTFVGNLLKEKLIEDFSWRNIETLLPMLRASSNFFVILSRYIGRSKIRNKNLNILSCEGSPTYNHVYEIAGLPKIDAEHTVFQCTMEQMMHVYRLIFTNVNYGAFISTHTGKLIPSRGSKRLQCKIELGKNFHYTKVRVLSKNAAIRLGELKGEYQYMAYRNNNVDSEREMWKARALLFLIDGLQLYDLSDDMRKKYSTSTSLFTYLSDTIKNKALSKAPLYVPTGSQNEYYSDIQYVMPLYKVKTQWDLSSVCDSFYKKRGKNKFNDI